jgi:hypothetical protein
MKCPKCGFTSFDYLDECKKCGVDISDVRSELGIIAVSPDERAASSPTGMMVDDSVGVGDVEAPADTEGLGGATFLGEDLSEDTFEDTFDSMVEPTGFDEGETLGEALGEEDQGIELDSPLPGPEAPEAPEAAPAEPAAEGKGEEGDEEFLDLDFGGIFEEDEK